jgi:ABC-type transport system involved in multi-copper enzyme maturation permease subunit
MRTFAIALNTAREAIRNKLLYSILLFAVVVVAVAALFGSVSIGDEMKFVKDFSLMSVSLFGVAIAVMLGVSMLHKEIGRKTIYNILSKPVARWEFIVGKFLGLLATLVLVVALMTVALLAIVAVFEGHVDWTLALGAQMTVLELMILVAVALFVSAVVVTPTVAGLVTAAAFVAGRCSGYLEYFGGATQPLVLRAIARALYWMLPHLDRLNVANQVAYGDPVSATHVMTVGVYACAYTGILLLLAIFMFSRRELA